PAAAPIQGTINYLASSGTVGQTVNAATTSTSVATSGSPSTYGDSVTFTATVTTGSPSAPVLEGSVKFYDGGTCALPGTQIGSAQTLDSTTGTGSVTTAALTGGSHTIRACYQGTINYLASSGTVGQTVNAATTSTARASTRLNSSHVETS